MSLIRLIRLEAMMTTEFRPRLSREVRTPWLPQHSGPVRMNWVVVTDHNGTAQLRRSWNARQDT